MVCRLFWFTSLDAFELSVEVSQLKDILAIHPVGPKLNPVRDPVDGVLIPAVEALRERDESGPRPVEFQTRATCLLAGSHKIARVVSQPIEIEEALVDDILVLEFLVLDKYSSSVTVQPEGLDSPCFEPVLNSDATKRTPKSVSKLPSMKFCSPFSRRTNPVSAWSLLTVPFATRKIGIDDLRRDGVDAPPGSEVRVIDMLIDQRDLLLVERFVVRLRQLIQRLLDGETD